MTPMVVSNAGTIASSLSDISYSIFRIVDSNNWKNVELLNITKETEVIINKIILNAKLEKKEIDFYYDQIISAINSSKLNSKQKRQFFQIMFDFLENV